MSAVLVREMDECQWPICYMSRAFCEAKVRYPQTKMLVFVLVVAARRLSPYFQAHPMKVLTDLPLKISYKG